jgi:hypothetical protein
LDESEYFNPDWDHAARRVMSPPFRNKQHQDSLWAGLMSGSLSVVATDHCAFTTEQKRFGLGNFAKIPNGTGGLEDRMPMLWTHGVATGRLTPNEFVAVTSTNIAKILNCYPKKGAVLVGADADLVVWDPEKSKTIMASKQQSSIDYNVFEGHTRQGPAALYPDPGPCGDPRRRGEDAGRPRQVRCPRAAACGEQGADPVEGPYRPEARGALGHPGDGGLGVSGFARFAFLIVPGGGREGDDGGAEIDVVQILGRGGEGEGRLQGVEKHGGPPVSHEVGSAACYRKGSNGGQRECEGWDAIARPMREGMRA